MPANQTVASATAPAPAQQPPQASDGFDAAALSQWAHNAVGAPQPGQAQAQPSDATGFSANDLSSWVHSVASQPAKAAAPAPKQPYALPDNPLGNAAAGVLGEAKGAFDMAVGGPGQFLAHAAASVYPSSWPGHQFLENQQNIADKGQQDREQAFNSLTRNAPIAGESGELAGNVIGAMAFPQKDAAEGGNLINRALAAGKTGGAIGAATPVQQDGNYWTQKAFQIGAGGLGASLFTPVVEGATALAGGAANKALSIGNRVINWFKGAPDDAVAAVAKDASPVLKAAVQKAVASGQKLDPAALGRQVQADSLPVKMTLTPGQAKQDPILFSNEMNTRSANPSLVYHLNEQNNQLIQNLNQVRDVGAPAAGAPDTITAGENLIKSGKDLLDAQDAKTSALYQKLADANGGNLPMDGVSFVDNAEAALKRQMKGAFLPPEISKIMDGVKDSGSMSFENFENLRTILAAAGRKADRAGDGNAEGAVSIVRDALENTPITSDVQGVKDLADQARSSAKYGFDLVRDNPLLKQVASGTAKDTRVIANHVLNASKSALSNLIGVFKDDPFALQTIKAGAINGLKDAAAITRDSGNVSQSGLNDAIEAMGPKLDVVFSPQEATTIRNIGDVARHVQLAPKGAFVNSSNTDVANLARSIGAKAVDHLTGTPAGTALNAGATRLLGNSGRRAAMRGLTSDTGAITSPSPASVYLSDVMPRQAARAATIPIATMLAHGVPQAESQLVPPKRAKRP